MTTLEIILICIIVWLVGVIVVLWLDRACKADLEDIFAIFLWFIAIPFFLIYDLFKVRKVSNRQGYDEEHACILKLPFGWEKFLIYRNVRFDYLADKENENFNEQDVAKVLQNHYGLSKSKIKYLRKTGQLEELTNKLKTIK